MSDTSFPPIFFRQLRYWSLHCLLNALPSLGIALGWIGLWKYPPAVAAMFAAIATFILLYATLTSLEGPLSDERHVLHRAVKLGTKIRSWISCLSLLMIPLGPFAMYTPDFWCGWLAISILNYAGKALGSGDDFFTPSIDRPTSAFGPVYVTTLLEGFILSFVLMMVCFICVMILQARDRKAFLAGGSAGISGR